MESVAQDMVTVIRPSEFVESCIPTRAVKPPAGPAIGYVTNGGDQGILTFGVFLNKLSWL
jgi:hypothetical protein